MGYPNSQGNPAGAIPVYIVNGGAPGGGLPYLGYQQITSLVSAQSLTVPDGATVAYVQPEDGNVRWKGDATNPTASVGMILWGTGSYTFAGALADLRFINMTGSTSKLNVAYYGVAP